MYVAVLGLRARTGMLQLGWLGQPSRHQATHHNPETLYRKGSRGAWARLPICTVGKSHPGYHSPSELGLGKHGHWNVRMSNSE